MRKTLLYSFLFLGSFFANAQSKIIFEYDEAGNQVFRGFEEQSNSSNTDNNSKPLIHNSTYNEEELAFFRKVQVSPNPTPDILYVDIDSQETKNSIDHILLVDMRGLTLHRLEIKKSLPLRFPIDLRHYPYGVYVLYFHMKDVKVFSKSIIKQ